MWEDVDLSEGEWAEYDDQAVGSRLIVGNVSVAV